MKKKISSVVLAICIVISLLPAISMPVLAEGYTQTATMTQLYEDVVTNGNAEPTSGNYSISSKEELEYFAEYSNRGKNTVGVTFYLLSDIELGYWHDDDNDGIVQNGEIYDSESGGTALFVSNWAPIGGYYYGGRNNFRGVFDGCGNTVSGIYLKPPKNSCGFFGCAVEAEIKNLGIVDSYIDSKSSPVGAVAGTCTLCTLTNCYNTGTVVGELGYIGGVIGSISGDVSGCYNTGTIICTGSDGRFVGGVAGIVGHGDDGRLFTNCYNAGTVTTHAKNVGGVVGYADDTIQYCYNTGSVTGSEYVGGIVGFNHINFGTKINIGIIKYCNNEGSVIGSSYPGGIAGGNEGEIQYCYNTADLESGIRMGGIVGYNIGGVICCYNTGNVGSGSGGGIVGCLDDRESGKVYYCYNTGDIGCTTGSFAGGIVAILQTGDVKYCYNSGTIIESTYCGGIVGQVRWNFSRVNYCRYDKQLGSVKGAVQGKDSTSTDATGNFGFLTSQMTGDGLKTGDTGEGWTSNYWIFEDGLYPRLKDPDTTDGFDFNGTDTALLMAAPAVLSGTSDDYDTVDSVTGDFTVCTYNGQIDWQSGASDVIAITDEDAEIKSSGTNVTLTATKNAATKTITIAAVTAPLSSDAGLVSVLSQTDSSPGSQSGADNGHAITWEISVPHSAASVSPSDAVAAAGTTIEMTDETFHDILDGAPLPLSEDETTTIYVQVTAENGTTALIYKVTITRLNTATVNTYTDGSPSAAPGSVELRQGGTTVYTATGTTTGVYTTDAADGTYDVYVNGGDTGTDIGIDGAAASVDIDYYTVAFTATDAGKASGSTISATAGAAAISNGDAVLSGKEIVITASGVGADKYTYAWSGAGTSGETAVSITITLGSAVDAICTVTGKTSPGYYAPSKTITVTENSSSLFSGSQGEVKAEADMQNAFSISVEVRVTETEEDATDFGLGTGDTVYPFDISLYIKGTDTKTEPEDGYAVTIYLPVPDELLDEKEQLSIAHKSGGGSVTTLSSRLERADGVWYLVFEATEFSPYALVASDAASFDEADGLPYYLDTEENAVFIGFAADGKYIAPDGVTVLLKENPKSFADVSGHWAADYIDFVTERELFASTGNNKFSPDIGMTRAMFATVIGRLYERSYGEIAAAGEHAFTDCDYEGWYGKYVGWAADNGIINGYGNGKFGPGDEITREQMATILYRFADFLGVLPSDIDTSLSYPDAGTISSWAEIAAMYCQQTGIITGRDGGNFVPRGTAARAEVAVVLERFIEYTV